MRALIFITMLIALVPAGARDVTRGDVAITVPDGKWKQATGTCTGDWVWHREGIGFSIGTRRYLKEDAEFRSSGDVYDIHRFTEIQSEVVAEMEPNGHLLKADKRKSKGGSEILVLEFDVDPDADTPSRSRRLVAFREANDRRSAVEVGCAFVESEKVLGMRIFEAALLSLCEEKTPSQITEPTAGGVTHR